MFFYLYTEPKSEGPAFQRVSLISSTKSEQDEKAKSNPDQLVIAQIHHNPGLNHSQGLFFWQNAVHGKILKILFVFFSRNQRPIGPLPQFPRLLLRSAENFPSRLGGFQGGGQTEKEDITKCQGEIRVDGFPQFATR